MQKHVLALCFFANVSDLFSRKSTLWEPLLYLLSLSCFVTRKPLRESVKTRKCPFLGEERIDKPSNFPSCSSCSVLEWDRFIRIAKSHLHDDQCFMYYALHMKGNHYWGFEYDRTFFDLSIEEVSCVLQ